MRITVPRWVLLLIALFTIAMGSACSFILDFTDTQCTSDDQCADLGNTNPEFRNTRCEQGVCVDVAQGGSGGGTNEPCTTADECELQNNGNASICREGECIQLVNDDCTTVLGGDNYKDPNTIILGMITATEEGPPALISLFMKDATTCSTQLAIDKLQTVLSNGIPNSADGENHKFAVVVCEETDGGEPAARHLVDTVGTKVVIGPLFGDVLGVAQNVTLPAGVLHLVPSSPVPSIASSVTTDGLLWTVMQSHGRTMRSLGKLVEVREQELRDANMALGEIRVALFNSLLLEDQQIAAFFLDDGIINFNGQTATAQSAQSLPDCPDGCFKRFNALDYLSGEGEVNHETLVEEMIDFAPHIVVLLTGDGDVITEGNAFVRMENAAAASGTTPEPFWLVNFADPTAETYQKGLLTLTDMMSDPRPGSAERFRSVRWPIYNQDLMQGLETDMRTACPAETSPVYPPVIEFWQDAFYLAVFAHLANGNHNLEPSSATLTGKKLAEGMLALSPEGHTGGDPLPLDFKVTDFETIANRLIQDIEVDVRGISGSLDFNAGSAGPVTGSGVADMDVLCLSHSMGDPPFTSAENESVVWAESGFSYDADDDAFVGTFDCPVIP